MKTPFFSIILPVYNAKNYISETLKSILDQEFKNYELLVIDDGSTDGSSDLVRKLTDGYSNIKYFRKENGGICDARNYGLEKAIGKYIMFCDHDDLMLNGVLSEVYSVLKKTNTNILKFSYETKVVKDSVIVKSYVSLCKEREVSNVELKEDYNQFNNFINTVWNGVYSREYLERYRLEFDEKIRFGQEDIVFNLRILSNNCKIIFLNNIFYLHFIRYGQSTSRKFDINKLQSINYSLVLEKEFLNDKITGMVKISLVSKYIRCYFVTIGIKYNIFKNKNVQELFAEFCDILPTVRLWELIKYSNCNLKNSIKIILFKIRAYQILFYLLRNQ